MKSWKMWEAPYDLATYCNASAITDKMIGEDRSLNERVASIMPCHCMPYKGLSCGGICLYVCLMSILVTNAPEPRFRIVKAMSLMDEKAETVINAVIHTMEFQA